MRKVKTLHIAIGIDLIGSRTSLAASHNLELLETPIGIEARSKNSNRTVIIPYSNCKGYELLSEKTILQEKPKK